MAVRLVVRRSIEGAGAEGDRQAWSYEFEQSRIVIGRSPGADVRLPELSVSEHHATLERSGASYALCDEGSTNGTRVGEIDLVAARPRVLSAGDEIAVGPFAIRFELGPLRTGVTAPERTASLARRMLRDLVGPEHPAAAPPRVTVIEGPDAGLSVSLGEPPATLVVGRGEGAGLSLSDADASRSHVELTRDADGVTARDLSSKNGLVINGKPVRERRLKHGDVLTLGNNALVYDDPAEQAIKDLDGQSDLTITRTRQVMDSVPPLTVGAAEEAKKPAPSGAVMAPRSSLDTAVYVLSGILLLASLAGLIWLFV